MRGVIVVTDAPGPADERRRDRWPHRGLGGWRPAAGVGAGRRAGAGDRRAIRCPASTPAEFEEFRLGLDDFLEVETAEEGLGPAFNGTSCAVCHNVPAIGGISPIAEVRAGRR